MSLSKLTFFLLLVGLFRTPALAQDGSATLYYIPEFGDPPLGCDCAQRTPFQEGHSFCIYWDNNNNGPDAADELVEVGASNNQANFNCAPFNGEGTGWGTGYFETDPPFYIATLPTPPDVPMYYLRTGGANCCWTSSVFVMQPGYRQIIFRDSNWTCSSSPCGGGAMPDPATNVQATDDLRCLQIRVSWEHTGLNITGFNIYVDDVFSLNTSSARRDTVMNITSTGPKTISVRAVNQQVESEPASDTGSMYLRHFVDGPEGDLGGDFPANSGFNIHFTRPQIGDCGAYLRLSLLVNNQFHSVLCEENSNVFALEMNCNLPSSQTPLNNCRLLLTSIPVGLPNLSFTDTTESVFNVGAVDAPERPGLVNGYGLSQNYPNPFNAVTEIEFTIPVTSNVSLDVYNIFGQHIATLVNSTMSAGAHTVRWDSGIQGDASVSSGIYLYRMVAGDFHAAGKMMLLK